MDHFDKEYNICSSCSKEVFVKKLNKYNDAYYNAEALIEDYEYDKLLELYENRFGKWTKVGSKVSVEFKKVALPYWMGSMDKIKYGDNKTLNNWKKKYGDGPFLYTPKLDGASCLFIYKNNKATLYTRGVGNEGRDISHLLSYISLPSMDNFKGKSFALRGEIIIPLSLYKNDLCSEYKNSRQIATSIVTAKNIKTDIARKLKIIFFEHITYKGTVYNQILQIEKMGFDAVDYKWNTGKDIYEELNFETMQKMLKCFRKECDYLLDGVVIYDTSQIYERNKSGNPKYAFAYKEANNSLTTRVTKVEWNASANFYLKPKVHFEQIEIDGIKIQKASGHNAQYIKDNGIGKGALIEVTRSNEVIPFITNVLKKSEPDFPPSYVWNESGVDILVKDEDNDEDLRKVTIKRMAHFAKTMEMKGISEKTIEKLYDNGCVSIEKLINIDLDEIENMKNETRKFGKKFSSNIYESKEKAMKDCELHRLMAATFFFGEGFGVRKFKIIVDNLGLEWTENKIAKLEGFSQESARKIMSGKEKFLKFLENNSIQYKSGENKRAGENVKNVKNVESKKYVFSGFRNTQLQKELEDLGHQVMNSISRNTDYLVVKNKEQKTEKIRKAEELGIEIINIDEVM